jgi:hypothetical protein
MKRIFSLAVVFCLSLNSWATEGMWLPLMLKAMQDDMQAQGMKLTAEDIYSVNQSSLKDAVVSFGGFCTGELISDQGLILTNHHCGYGAIQDHSTVKNDLLTDGFWAMNKSQEKTNEGLFVTFLVRMEDVTDQILTGLSEGMNEEERQKLIDQHIEEVSTKATEGTGYGAIIKPFFYGNEYYMFITETYEDVRLVGAPPSSIGKFGGDTDNWMWPRHTGDFSLFRVYAGPDGKPAKYSPENIPLKPKAHLPVSLDGVQEGDFTMVFGFPGRTQEYLTSDAVNMLMEQTNPHRIDIRDKRLEIMADHMAKNDTVRIQYASKYASVANYWKKWIGENRGLKQLNTLEAKKEQEKMFTEWVNADDVRKSQYGNLLPQFADLYKQQQKVDLASTYRREAIFGVDLMRLASAMSTLATESIPAENFNQQRDRYTSFVDRHFKNYDLKTDRELFTEMLLMYKENVPLRYQSGEMVRIPNTHGAVEAFAKYIYDKSVLTDRKKVENLLADYPANRAVRKLRNDVGYKFFSEIQEIYDQRIAPVYAETDPKLELLYRTYVAGLRSMKEDSLYYPDANSTMRISYGIVDGYKPADGVRYKHYTTLVGIMEKEDPTNEEFIVPARLKEIYLTKDYGKYAEDEYMPVCFIASNHTTGGNSGSPVIDAQGRLIGLNFDRTWESTMSDIDYSADICRNIAVDIRYVLLIIDKFAGAGHLVDEMTLSEGELVRVEEAVEMN